jgi:sugar/nucleoside kinase (ribokinase family)
VLTKLHAPDVPKIMAAHWAKGALTVGVLPRRGRQPLAAQVLIASEADLTPEEQAAPLRLGQSMCGEALRWMVVTRGARGAEAYGVDGSHHAAPAERVEVVDATGAGDVFAAGLLDALLRGEGMPAALRRGTAWAARHIAHEGSLPPAGVTATS